MSKESTEICELFVQYDKGGFDVKELEWEIDRVVNTKRIATQVTELINNLEYLKEHDLLEYVKDKHKDDIEKILEFLK